MSKRPTTLVALAVGLAACGEPTVANPIPSSPLAGLETSMVEALSPSDLLTEPGFVLHFQTEDGETISLISGASNLEHAQPITTDTAFHIASLSKQITGAALALSIESGLVTLDDPVATWVPEVAHFGQDLTVGHLAYMTSGIPEYYDQSRPGEWPWYTDFYFDVEDAIGASLAQDSLTFRPGSEWQYSNINYMLITKIVSAAHGKPFSTIVEEQLFAPLGMTSSLIHDDPTLLIPNRADAYYLRSDEMLESWASVGIDIRPGDGYISVHRGSPHYGGSGVVTTMADWALWQNEVMTNDTLGSGFWEIMLARRPYEHPKTNDALGLVHGDYNGWPTLWYEGGDIDVSSYAITLPDAGLSVSCFSNAPAQSCRDRVIRSLELAEDAGILGRYSN